jgi:hypothetical protein
MPYAEFYSWQLFYRLEPWGFERAELHKAEILAMLYAINRGKGKVKDVADFMPDRLKGILADIARDVIPEELTREQLIARIKRDLGAK